MLRSIVVCLALSASLTVAAAARAQDEAYQLRIATGRSVGLYASAGHAICRLLRDVETTRPIVCRDLFSQGSISNLERLRDGTVEMAIVQSDVHHFAYNEEDPRVLGRPFTDLRHVASLMDETLTVLARPLSRILFGEDVIGRRVFLGEAGSGTAFMIDMLASLEGRSDAIEIVQDVTVAQAATALCRGRIDALAFVVGHPNALVRDVTSRCDTLLVQGRPERIDDFVLANPFYTAAEVPGGLYPGIDEPVPTIGVTATLVTRRDVPDEVVRAVATALYDGLPELRRLHLTFTAFDEAVLARGCNTAPLHDAVAAFLDERGIEQGPC